MPNAVTIEVRTQPCPQCGRRGLHFQPVMWSRRKLPSGRYAINHQRVTARRMDRWQCRHCFATGRTTWPSREGVVAS